MQRGEEITNGWICKSSKRKLAPKNSHQAGFMTTVKAQMHTRGRGKVKKIGH
jgi:hypothetical protein